MKIYTRTGDQGETGLLGGSRVAKDDSRIEAFGTVDELNCCLGLVRTEPISPTLDSLLSEVQHTLFTLGAQLATANPRMPGGQEIKAAEIERLELAIDEFESKLSPLRNFILPAGSRAGALLHMARAICRRAERRVVSLGHDQVEVGTPLRYLNRLSDLLFVLARTANKASGVEDVNWTK